jgi:DNA-directed RNA polymerase subunit RPC12/RpoP
VEVADVEIATIIPFTDKRVKGQTYNCAKCGKEYVAVSKIHKLCTDCGKKRDVEVRGKLGIRE